MAYGERCYGRIPAGIARRRLYWEFGCAIEGRIAPLTPGRPQELRHRRLWAFPPEVAHGWTGDDHPAQVVMLQPHQVPDPLARAARWRGRAGRELVWDMAEEDARWLGAEAAALLPGIRSPGLALGLRQERLIVELAIRLLANLGCDIPAETVDREAQVAQALAWLEENLHQPVTEADLGRSLHLSPSHLRRIFHRVRGAPPRDELARLRIERAELLMSTTSDPIAGIALACGFSSDAAFSRAFIRLRGKRPGRWRAEGARANLHPTHAAAGLPPPR